MAVQEKKKVTAIVIDGFEINAPNVTYHKLQEFALTLYEKLLVQRRERNTLTLERDRLRMILENTRHEIIVTDETIRNTEREIDRAEERFRYEKKEVEDEVKWLLYEHGTNMEELKAWENKELGRVEQRDLEDELELLREKRKIKEGFLEKENKLFKERDNVKNVQQQQLEQHIHIQEKKQIEYEMHLKRKFFDTVEHMNLKHEMEMSEIDERKNAHLVELKRIHKERLEETKYHFNAITAGHLAVISNLKQNIDMMKKNKITALGEIKSFKKENDILRNTLEKLKSETKHLNRQAANYKKDIISLKNNKVMLKQARSKTIELKCESDKAMERIVSDGFDMRLRLDEGCSSSILGFKNIAWDKRERLEVLVKSMLEELTNKQKLISNLSADPDVSKALKELRFEYWNPKQLSYELALICKSCDELSDTFERKLIEFCLPEKKFERKYSTTKGVGPAALVSKQ